MSYDRRMIRCLSSSSDSHSQRRSICKSRDCQKAQRFYSVNLRKPTMGEGGESFQSTTTNKSELGIVTDSIGSNQSIRMQQELMVTGDQRIPFPDGFPMNGLRGELLLNASPQLKDTGLIRQLNVKVGVIEALNADGDQTSVFNVSKCDWAGEGETSRLRTISEIRKQRIRRDQWSETGWNRRKELVVIERHLFRLSWIVRDLVHLFL